MSKHETDLTYRNGIGYRPGDSWGEDNGTMPDNVEEFEEAILGHRIVHVERNPQVGDTGKWRWGRPSLALTLDTGQRVILSDTSDCCAYTNLDEVIEHLPTVDHVITAVNTTGNYTRWHIVADLGEVLELQVGWSSGNPFYYGYGFEIEVIDP